MWQKMLDTRHRKNEANESFRLLGVGQRRNEIICISRNRSLSILSQRA